MLNKGLTSLKVQKSNMEGPELVVETKALSQTLASQTSEKSSPGLGQKDMAST